ncbi:ATP-dependent sacrificial sulfur transferase LarE [bacterium]|nr:ATP-dependent sacrificial sulfur transferase LarE [bacterium]
MSCNNLDKALETKLDALCRIIKTHFKVAVAYSGGVDSAFLAFIVNRELGQENAIALMADTSLVPQFEIDIAIKTAETMGLNFKDVKVNPFAKEFVENPPDRCYHCKKIIFTELINAASQVGFDILADGSNADDTKEYRPGFKALAELEIPSPLMQVGLTKAEIRTLSRHFDLPTADIVSSTCLATRIPYYTEIDTAKLKAVEKSEAVLRELGFENFRVRYHGDIARIEVQPEQMDKIMEYRETIIIEFKKIGFIYVTVDLVGYRSGSMDEALKENGDEH